MREALFIKRNRNRWKQIQDNPSDHPDEMAQEFIQLVEDLGYSKTFYPVSKTTQYLNGAAAKKYLDIYQNKKESSNRMLIFINNVKVSLQEFGGGILFGYFTVTGLMQNSVMVGAFEYMFYSNGLLQNSLLTIMLHGSLELSTFVIAATSGLVLAKRWIFPGTIKRIDALKQGEKEGLMIALSNIPMLLIAAFFEGFLTRHTDMPLWLKLLIITISLIIVVGYFVVYPIHLKRKLNSAAQ